MTMDGGTIAAIAIGGVTLLLVVVSLIFGSGLWRWREKVKIKVTRLEYMVDVRREVIAFLDFEFHRSGGIDIRHVSRVILKPDQETYDQLKQYYEIPQDRIIQFNTRVRLSRYEVVTCSIQTPAYKISPNIQNPPKRSEVEPIASQLSQKSYKVGLVWEDNGKTTWKTISPETFAKWV